MLSENGNGNGLIMPVAPMYGGGGFGNGGFGNNGDWGWIILLLLLAGGGWGNGFGGGMFGGNDIYPWMNQANITSEGFQNQLMNDNVTSIRDGVQGISTQLCNGFAGVNASIANGFASAEQGANTRQMANMQQMYNLSSQFADCCCENRLATCQTQNIITRESAETRFADANNTRDIIQSQTSGFQTVLDKLCQLELDQYKRENDSLRSQLSDARFNASQIRQTADIQNNIVNELRSCPIPSQPVYGSQPIFTCPNNNSGCGCGNF